MYRAAALAFLLTGAAQAQDPGGFDPIDPIGVRPLPDCGLARPADFYACWRPPHPDGRVISVTISPASLTFPDELVHVWYAPGVEALLEKRAIYSLGRAWPVAGPVEEATISAGLRTAFEVIGPFDLYRAALPPFGSDARGDGYDLTTIYTIVVVDPADRDSAVKTLRSTEGVLYAGPPRQVELRSAQAEGP